VAKKHSGKIEEFKFYYKGKKLDTSDYEKAISSFNLA